MKQGREFVEVIPTLSQGSFEFFGNFSDISREKILEMETLIGAKQARNKRLSEEETRFLIWLEKKKKEDTEGDQAWPKGGRKEKVKH